MFTTEINVVWKSDAMERAGRSPTKELENSTYGEVG